MKQRFLNYCLIAFLIVLYSCSGNPVGNDDNSGNEKNITTGEKSDPKKPFNARYNIKSGIITYNATIMLMDQQIIMYFDDWGRKERREINISIMGKKLNNVTLSDTTFVYTYNPEKNEGTRMPLDTENPDNINFTNLNDDKIRKFNIVKEGKETILDRNCIVYSMDYKKAGISGKYTIWNGINLKTEASAQGMSVKIEAIKIEENVSIPVEKFIPPKSINFKAINSIEDMPGFKS